MSDPDLTDFIMQKAGRTPLLTGDEEITLSRQVQAMLAIQDLPHSERPSDWERIMKRGQRAKERMVAANLRLVIKVAAKYMNRGMDLPDLIQEGSLGLMRGIEKYDPERGYKLSTYIYWWIRQAITRAIRDKARTIRIPLHVQEQLTKAKRVQRQLNLDLERPPTLAEVADRAGLTEIKLRQIYTWSAQCTSLDAKITGSKDESTDIGALIADPSLHPTDIVSTSLKSEQIEALLQDLNPKEQFVIRCRFGFETGDTMSHQKIAPHLGISRERVRQIQNNALKKLRLNLAQSGDIDLLAG